MKLVDNDTFLSHLTTLFNDTKEKGSIWLTHKRLHYDGTDAIMDDAGTSEESREYPCLLRLTDGGKNKFSTKVEPGQLEKFHAAYGSLLKASMTTLRKRDKKREKIRSEEAAARKKKMTELVVVDAGIAAEVQGERGATSEDAVIAVSIRIRPPCMHLIRDIPSSMGLGLIPGQIRLVYRCSCWMATGDCPPVSKVCGQSCI
ncbi:Signal recognition particle 14 kDa protein [Termitomyces sp. T112]|nr:Signal recognition particle 14 kDa protein [Termitomyces sp. T112]